MVHGGDRRRRGSRAVGAGALLALIVCAVAATAGAQGLRLHVIDVGQGDGLLLQCPDESVAMIVDSADPREAQGGIRAWKEYVYPLLGPTTPIPLVVATHPHADHIGGLDWLLHAYEVDLVVDNGRPPGRPTATYRRYLEARKRLPARKRRAAAEKPATVKLCGGEVVATYFVPPGMTAAICRRNANECSVIVHVRYRDTSFLLTGDAEHLAEERLLANPRYAQYLDVDVLKIGHHGSDTSSTRDFLRATSPTCVVISAGDHLRSTTNKGPRGYRHPRRSTIDAVNDQLAPQPYRPGTERVWAWSRTTGWTETPVRLGLSTTRTDGNVVVSSDGTSVTCR
jgi:beta-lactamase superfamily II metal-dependent hydrolase